MRAVLDASYFVEAIERSWDVFFDGIFEISDPSLLPYEVWKSFCGKKKRGTLTEAQRASVQVVLDSISIEDGEWSDIYNLARKHKLTFYDASYLQSAIDKQAALATCDKALLTAASTGKVPLSQESDL